MDDQLDVLFRHRGMGQDPEPVDERVREERKRYTTQLQRRALAHVTAELGGGAVMPDIDRQVTSVLQHAQDATKARRVTYFAGPSSADGAGTWRRSCPTAASSTGWSHRSRSGGRG